MIKVGLVQINNSFSGQNYLPYTMGLFEAYARKHLKEVSSYQFLLPIYKRGTIRELLTKIDGADIVFFSVYVWNYNISLELARQYKKLFPKAVIVFGGPNVPHRSEPFLRQNPFIDLACHGEGENIFLRVLETPLENAIARKWGSIPSTSFLDPEGRFHLSPRSPRIVDLDSIPSPYLTGVFDSLMKANPQEQWIILWETNRGCPFSCAYCDWGSAVATKIYKFNLERLQQEVDWFSSRKMEFVFCADANFGILKRDYDIVHYVTETKKKTGYPHALSVQNTKNATDRAYEVQKLLSDSGMNKGVTISLQTTDPVAMKNVKRENISNESYFELQRRFNKDRVETYSDMILGLPGETYESFVQGISAIVCNGQHNRIQFGNLVVLCNAAINDPDYIREHGLITVDSVVVNIHGAMDVSKDEILERQVLVVGTKACAKEDWIKARTFAWFCNFLYFNKLLQIPILLIMREHSIPFHELIQAFSDGDLSHTPHLLEIQKFFRTHASNLQKGGPEFTSSREWLGIWWPSDELAMIHLCTQGKLQAFYDESKQVLSDFLKKRTQSLNPILLQEMFDLSQKLIKQPFQNDDLTLRMTHNLWDYYQAARVNEDYKLQTGQFELCIDRTSQTWDSWETWCREVIWWGNKRGAYIYGLKK